jgi:hypothetical protein
MYFLDYTLANGKQCSETAPNRTSAAIVVSLALICGGTVTVYDDAGEDVTETFIPPRHDDDRRLYHPTGWAYI